MSLADQVREYCYEHYILPAKNSNEQTFEIKTGDVHRALNYQNRYPLVCSAIGATTFESTYGVERINVFGPLNGANTLFKFKFKK